MNNKTNNKTKIITVILPLVFYALSGFAQSAYGDVWNALIWSQEALNLKYSADTAASIAAHAFDGGRDEYYGSSSSRYYSSWNREIKASVVNSSHKNSSGHSYGSTVTSAQPSRRTATNMSKVGLKISSSGYNRGAELARNYAEQRAERARLKAERDQKMVNSYMQTQYEYTQQMEMSWQIYIANNSHAKPFSQETINEFVSNGLPGNVIIDDNGAQNMLPEALLEGAGSIEGPNETLDEKFNNEEELSDEELDFLLAQALKRKAELEEEKRQLEESIAENLNEESKGVLEKVNNQFDSKIRDDSSTSLIDENDELNAAMTSPASISVPGTPESHEEKEEGLGVIVPSDLEESITFLPEGCTYTVLLQPSRTMKSAQMVYGEGYTSPLLRNEGKLFKLANNEVEEMTAYKLPKEIGNGESVFILNNQLICKCGNSVKCNDSKSMKELFSLTDANFNIYPAFDGEFYLVKYNADSSSVYLFDTQTKKFTKQYDTPFQIENFASTGMEGVVTSGKLVYHVSTEVRTMGEVTGSNVQSVTYTSKGMFLSNEKACYCMDLSGKSYPFMVSNIKQVMMLDNRLYLLFESGMLSVIDSADKIMTLLDKVKNE